MSKLGIATMLACGKFIGSCSSPSNCQSGNACFDSDHRHFQHKRDFCAGNVYNFTEKFLLCYNFSVKYRSKSRNLFFCVWVFHSYHARLYQSFKCVWVVNFLSTPLTTTLVSDPIMAGVVCMYIRIKIPTRETSLDVNLTWFSLRKRSTK